VSRGDAARPARAARATRTARWSPWAAVVLGLAIGAAMPASGCVVRNFTGPQLTGTCNGACAHYVQCKPGHGDTDRTRCLAECPDVFSDRDSLMAYESLACDDAVDYVDGHGPKTAAQRR
jgi:hypothetical protein